MRSTVAWLAVIAGLTACASTAKPILVTTQSTSTALPTAATTAVSAASPMVGRWRVIGCETSPLDPDNCAQGEILFDAQHWSVKLPCCEKTGTYTMMSADKDRVTISTEGRQSVIQLGADGTAEWDPWLEDTRVGKLSFVRVP